VTFLPAGQTPLLFQHFPERAIAKESSHLAMGDPATHLAAWDST